MLKGLRYLSYNLLGEFRLASAKLIDLTEKKSGYRLLLILH